MYLNSICIESITKLRYCAQNTFGQVNDKIIDKSLIRLQEVSTPPLFRNPAHYSYPVSAATAYRRRRRCDDLRAVCGRPAATAQSGCSAPATWRHGEATSRPVRRFATGRRCRRRLAARRSGGRRRRHCCRRLPIGQNGRARLSHWWDCFLRLSKFWII